MEGWSMYVGGTSLLISKKYYMFFEVNFTLLKKKQHSSIFLWKGNDAWFQGLEPVALFLLSYSN